MIELSVVEITQVSGGDSWAGTPAGQAPYDNGMNAFNQCVLDGILAGGGGSGTLMTMLKCAVQTYFD